MYEIQYAEAPATNDSVWIHTSSARRKVLIDQLLRRKANAFKVAAAGSDPGRVWSDEIISYVMYRLFSSFLFGPGHREGAFLFNNRLFFICLKLFV